MKMPIAILSGGTEPRPVAFSIMRIGDQEGNIGQWMINPDNSVTCTLCATDIAVLTYDEFTEVEHNCLPLWYMEGNPHAVVDIGFRLRPDPKRHQFLNSSAACAVRIPLRDVDWLMANGVVFDLKGWTK